MRISLDGTRRVQPLLANPPVERNGVVSPDGRWLAYEELDRDGQFQVYVRPFPNVSAGPAAGAVYVTSGAFSRESGYGNPFLLGLDCALNRENCHAYLS